MIGITRASRHWGVSAGETVEAAREASLLGEKPPVQVILVSVVRELRDRFFALNTLNWVPTRESERTFVPEGQRHDTPSSQLFPGKQPLRSGLDKSTVTDHGSRSMFGWSILRLG